MKNPPRRTPTTGTSVRTKVTLSMLCAAALVVPVVILSLFYIRRMNDAVSSIVDKDIELMHVADRISLDFLEARRDEKNFLLYRDSSYLSGSYAALQHIGELCSKGKTLAPNLAARFNLVVDLTVGYRRLADSLINLPHSELGLASSTPGLRTLLRHHQSLVNAAELSTDSTRRDSLLELASELAGEITPPVPTGRQGRLLNDSIRFLQAAIVAQTDSIIDHTRRQVIGNRQRARQLATWGQRNIVTTLLLLLAVLVWLILTLPRRLVLPIKRLVNALRRAEQGNLNIRVTPKTRDELGELALQLNRVFARLRGFDQRKTDYIQQLERRFRLLTADIAEGVLVVDRTPNIVHINHAMEKLVECDPSEAKGKQLNSFKGLSFLYEPLSRVLAGDTSRQVCDVLPEMPGSALCIETLRNKNGDVIGALVVITRPGAAAENDD